MGGKNIQARGVEKAKQEMTRESGSKKVERGEGEGHHTGGKMTRLRDLPKDKKKKKKKSTLIKCGMARVCTAGAKEGSDYVDWLLWGRWSKIRPIRKNYRREVRWPSGEEKMGKKGRGKDILRDARENREEK